MCLPGDVRRREGRPGQVRQAEGGPWLAGNLRGGRQGDQKSSLSIVNRNAQFAAGTDSITIADLALLATYSTMKVGRVGSGVVEILI